MAIQFEKLNKNSDRPTHISKTGLGKGKQKYFKGWPQEKGLTTKFYEISCMQGTSTSTREDLSLGFLTK